MASRTVDMVPVVVVVAVVVVVTRMITTIRLPVVRMRFTKTCNSSTKTRRWATTKGRSTCAGRRPVMVMMRRQKRGRARLRMRCERRRMPIGLR